MKDTDVYTPINYEAIETVLNELENLKAEKATAWEEWNNIDQYCDQEKQKYEAELEKKEKIINEMAIYLADIDFDECCAEIPEPCLGCSWEDYEPHINCIKRYFTNKVEREGK